MVSRTVEKRIYEKFYHRCAICDSETDFDEGEIDHILSKAKGGTDEPRNLQWLCHRCNKLKGQKRTNEEVSELLDNSEVVKIVKDFNYELKDLKEEFIVRGALEITCDNFLKEPQKILNTYNHYLKSMGIEPNLETVVTFIAGNIMGATIMTSVPNEGGIEKMAERIPEVVEVLKRRIPKMMEVFQSATQQ